MTFVQSIALAILFAGFTIALLFAWGLASVLIGCAVQAIKGKRIDVGRVGSDVLMVVVAAVVALHLASCVVEVLP